MEGAVQRIGAKEAERLADFELKTALLDHFSSLPDLYEVLSVEAASKLAALNGRRRGRRHEVVKHAVTTIEWAELTRVALAARAPSGVETARYTDTESHPRANRDLRSCNRRRPHPNTCSARFALFDARRLLPKTGG